MESDPTAPSRGQDALRAIMEAEAARIKRLPQWPRQRRGLSDLLDWLPDQPWPPSERDIDTTMQVYDGISREDAIEQLSIPRSIRSTLETYLGLDVRNERSLG